MLKRIETAYGHIDIERPVAAKIIKETILSHREVYGITNAKGKRSSFMSRFAFDKNADYITIRKNKEDEIEIEFYMILHFGVSISDVTRRIGEEIRQNMQELLDGMNVSIVQHVIGLKSSVSSGKIVERDITVVG